MGRQIRCVPRLSQPHGAERRAAHDALRPLRMRVPRRVGGVVHRGGLSGGNAAPRISSLGTVEGARPAVQETLRTGMIQSRLLRRLGLLAALAAGYFVAGKVGLEVAYVHPSATVVWPPSGLTLAAFLLLGYEVWPAILLGAFLVNITTAGSIATSAAIAAGNTLEGLVGAYLVNRFARGHRACERARDVFKLAGLAALLSTTISATAGVVSLSLGGFAQWTDFGSIWSSRRRCSCGRRAPACAGPGARRSRLSGCSRASPWSGSSSSMGWYRGAISTIRWNSCASRSCYGWRSGSSSVRRRRSSSCSPASRFGGRCAGTAPSPGHCSTNRCCCCRRSKGSRPSSLWCWRRPWRSEPKPWTGCAGWR